MLRIVTVAIGLVIFPGFGFNETVNFDALKPGAMPPYWTAVSSSHWEVKRDPRAPTRQNVLADVSTKAADSERALAIYDRAQCQDGDLSVKFKIAGGRSSRTAGIVWRYQDENNYYLLDFSADENRIALYRVQDGKTRVIPISGGKPGAIGVKHEIHADQWYVAKATFQGSRVQVSFGNRRLFNAVDDGITVEGKTGLWAKAGTAAEFDDYRVERKTKFTKSELVRFFRR